jgi:hypothetical protein
MHRLNPHRASLPIASLFALAIAVAGGAALALLPGGSTAFAREPAAAPQSENEAAAKAAFLAAYPVFMHPRCLNCHPAGDIPLQGDDGRLHTQNVQRGAAGMGKYALRCINCHQLANTPGENMPPGVPNWHMPPPKMKMVFEGKSARELCRQFKDPKQNGGHATAAGAVEHLEKDPLVHWGWAPGDGRSTPPLSHADFVRKMHEWVQNGAACPE